MSLHPNFPSSPYAPLIPEVRWFPADEALRVLAYEKLIPPLVANVRREVHAWRTEGYSGGSTRIEDWIRLRDTRPFRTEPRGFLLPKKSIFNRIVGEPGSGGLELAFAAFLDAAPDVTSFVKNYLAVGFKLDYVKADGDLSTYTPDFMVKTADGVVWFVETKGREELDLPQKMARLRQWCADATAASDNAQRYDFVYVDEEGFERHKPRSFAALAASFREHKG